MDVSIEMRFHMRKLRDRYRAWAKKPTTEAMRRRRLRKANLLDKVLYVEGFPESSDYNEAAVAYARQALVLAWEIANNPLAWEIANRRGEAMHLGAVLELMDAELPEYSKVLPKSI